MILQKMQLIVGVSRQYLASPAVVNGSPGEGSHVFNMSSLCYPVPNAALWIAVQGAANIVYIVER
jgi:hypothetical protein